MLSEASSSRSVKKLVRVCEAFSNLLLQVKIVWCINLVLNVVSIITTIYRLRCAKCDMCLHAHTIVLRLGIWSSFS